MGYSDKKSSYHGTAYEDQSKTKEERSPAQDDDVERNIFSKYNEVQAKCHCRACAGKISCRTVRSRTKLMNILIEQGKAHEVPTVFQKLIKGGHKPSLITYTTLLAALTIERKYDCIQPIIAQVEENKMKLDSIFFNAVINAFSESGKMEEAMKMFRMMKESGLTPTTSTYNTLIKGYGISSKPEDSAELVDLMSREGTVTPNLRTYNVLVRAWCRKGETKEAWTVVRDIVASGIQPDAVTYNTIAAAYATEGKTVKAEEMVAEMQLNNVKPNERTGGIIIGGYCKEGRMKEALEFIYKMKRIGVVPNLVAFNSLIKGFASVMDRESLDEVLSLMEDLRVKPDVVTFSTVMNAWSTAGFIDKCQEIFQHMVKAGVKPDAHAYSILAKSYVRAKEPEKAEQLIDLMAKSESKPNVVFFTTVISGWCGVGRMDCAILVFRRMCQYGISPNLRTFETLILGYIEAKQPWKVEEVVQMMKEFGVKPESTTFSLLADAWHVSGLTKDSYRVLKTAKTDVVKAMEERSLEKPSTIQPNCFTNELKGTGSVWRGGRMVLKDLEFGFECSWLRGTSMCVPLSCKYGVRLSIICQKQTQGQVGVYGQLPHSCTVFLN